MKRTLLAAALSITIGLEAQWTDSGNNITTTDNVGIGTTNPTQKLQIHEGNVNIYGFNTSRYIRFTETNLQGSFINYDGDLNILSFGVHPTNDADTTNDFKSISIPRSTGNVGIGTTTPDSKLTVKGNIHAEEVKVDLSVPGPDYVFKEGYNLKSLEEVQNYIKEHGHLPNIPSAKEMEVDGIQLGEMNIKLLEKIEELTLYVLEQERKHMEKDKRILELEERLLTIEQFLNR